jgi:hypothetical protein
VLDIVVGFAPLKPAEFVIISLRMLLNRDALGRRDLGRMPHVRLRAVNK